MGTGTCTMAFNITTVTPVTQGAVSAGKVILWNQTVNVEFVYPASDLDGPAKGTTTLTAPTGEKLVANFLFTDRYYPDANKFTFTLDGAAVLYWKGGVEISNLSVPITAMLSGYTSLYTGLDKQALKPGAQIAASYNLNGVVQFTATNTSIWDFIPPTSTSGNWTILVPGTTESLDDKFTGVANGGTAYYHLVTSSNRQGSIAIAPTFTANGQLQFTIKTTLKIPATIGTIFYRSWTVSPTCPATLGGNCGYKAQIASFNSSSNLTLAAGYLLYQPQPNLQ